ncbi:MAG: hypothetical protein LBO81_04020 [Clostridiales Family XIII bacterium]|jgi:hypothetical protein|nr:hypothetical protein [Clostridiales Family XIII bacterium]
MAKTLRKRELNLLLAMDGNKVKTAATGKRTAVLALLLFVLLLIAAAAVLFFLKVAEFNDGKEKLQLYLEESETAYAEAVRVGRRAEEMRAQATRIEGTATNLAGYPKLTGENLVRLFALAGDSVRLFDVKCDGMSGQFSFSAECGDATRIPIFLAELRGSDLFGDVTYEGYTGTSFTVSGAPTIRADGSVTSNESTGRKFTFHVRGLLVAPGPAPEEDGTTTDENAGGAETENGEETDA